MAKKLIDLSNLQKLVNDVLRPKIDSKQPKIITATIGTAAATAAKTCTIADYTPAVGDILMLTFTLGNSVNTPTLNINGGGAKNIVLGSTNASTITLTLGANGVAMLAVAPNNTYQLFGSYRTSDSDNQPYITVRNNSGRTVNGNELGYIKDGQYVSIYASGSVPSLVKRTDAIDLFSNFVLNSSSTVANGSNGSFFLSQTSMTITNSLNGLTLTAYQPLYLVGSPTSDGKFVIDNTSLTSHFTQTLPTSVDNKIYVELGYATGTASIAFIPVKRWLTYVDGLGIVDLYRKELNEKAPNNIIPGWTLPLRAEGPGNANSWILLSADKIPGVVAQRDSNGSLLVEGNNNNLYAAINGLAAADIIALSKGRLLYQDPTFRNGLNGLQVYNYQAGLGSLTRMSGAAPNDTNYFIRCTTSDHLGNDKGGFTFAYNPKLNGYYALRIIAKIPENVQAVPTSNGMGTGGGVYTLTHSMGTGDWKEYVFIYKMGSSGTLGDAGYVYFYSSSVSSPTIDIAYATMVDLSASPELTIPQNHFPVRTGEGAGYTDSFAPYKKTYSKTASLTSGGNSMYIDIAELDLRIYVRNNYSNMGDVTCKTISGNTKTYDIITNKNGYNGSGFNHGNGVSIGYYDYTIFTSLVGETQMIINTYISLADVNSKVFELIVFFSGTSMARSRMFIREL
ncbi:MAG: hypothetical protein BGO29_14755 [Bacteroidales bacterium 36-12]|nr:MAG: hypothetical protein BGO29_14755 [Bacteroidales bacterium 36-12]